MGGRLVLLLACDVVGASAGGWVVWVGGVAAVEVEDEAGYKGG